MLCHVTSLCTKFPADVSGVLVATLSCARYSIAHLPAMHSHIHIE